MKRHETFTEYLHDRAVEEGVFDGIPKDLWEETFDNWITDEADPAQLVEWGDKYGEQFNK